MVFVREGKVLILRSRRGGDSRGKAEIAFVRRARER